MDVVVDASGAGGGGLGRFVSALAHQWSLSFGEEDHVHVVTTKAFAATLAPDLPSMTVHTPRRDCGERVVSQYMLLPRILREVRPDGVLSTLPIVPFRVPRTRSWVWAGMVYDLRHELSPGDFSRLHLLTRKVVYPRAYRVADVLVAISQRTRNDLIALRPSTADKTLVVELGVDGAMFAGMPTAPFSPSGVALAYAHHTNKRPEMVIDAWAELRRRDLKVPVLVIVGADSKQSTGLRARWQVLGMPAGALQVRGVLSTPEYQALWTLVCIVLLPSTFEGFGLPVLEGLLRGVPVVVSQDEALREVGQVHVSVMTEDSSLGLADAVALAWQQDCPERRLAGAAHARTFTWARTARAIRELMFMHHRTNQAQA